MTIASDFNDKNIIFKVVNFNGKWDYNMLNGLLARAIVKSNLIK